jgi:hypothetical protein
VHLARIPGNAVPPSIFFENEATDMAPEYKTSEELIAAYEKRAAEARHAETETLPSYLSVTEVLRILRRSMA